jgi:hypothetical protein
MASNSPGGDALFNIVIPNGIIRAHGTLTIRQRPDPIQRCQRVLRREFADGFFIRIGDNCLEMWASSMAASRNPQIAVRVLGQAAPLASTT